MKRAEGFIAASCAAVHMWKSLNVPKQHKQPLLTGRRPEWVGFQPLWGDGCKKSWQMCRKTILSVKKFEWARKLSMQGKKKKQMARRAVCYKREMCQRVRSDQKNLIQVCVSAPVWTNTHCSYAAVHSPPKWLFNSVSDRRAACREERLLLSEDTQFTLAPNEKKQPDAPHRSACLWISNNTWLTYKDLEKMHFLQKCIAEC